MRLALPLFWAGILLSLVACKQASTLEFQQKNLAFDLEGPLFSGPNTAQATFPSAAFEDFLKQNGVTMEQVDKIVLSEAKFSAAADTLNFDNCAELVLQLVSDKTAMNKFGVLNPIPVGAKTIQPAISTEKADVAEYFKTAPFTILADVNLKNDQDAGMSMRGDFTFKVTVLK